jgi:long-subunit fatty acid transport protein
MINKEYLDEIVIETRNDLQKHYETSKNKALEDYAEQTNDIMYPESLKREFEHRIKNNFQWLKDINWNKWKDMSERIKQSNNLEKQKKEIVSKTTDLLKRFSKMEDFKGLVGKNLKTMEASFERNINESLPTDD